MFSWTVLHERTLYHEIVISNLFLFIIYHATTKKFPASNRVRNLVSANATAAAATNIVYLVINTYAQHVSENTYRKVLCVIQIGVYHFYRYIFPTT